MDGCEFMREWLVAVEGDVLVSVCRFAIDIKMEASIRVMDNGDVQHCNASILLYFFRPFDVRVD